jgi:hypothetical protein
LKKRKNSNPGDLIRTRSGNYAIVGEYGSLMTYGVFRMKADGSLISITAMKKGKKLPYKERRALR